mmetsp:Transcript_17820/g.32879  ORF Transcript_17820/g.32879 Transcript_17820/m.32879 type:complete len:93 (-) Transcript_17820:199-477(-)|eukprot:CAMPEP_0184528856 /NCGR_PEP_ID=MMETSP0198_2-20121128/12029_1 /TAXON_ID=1112570 /ORGANISM="Thraustochytrium sp., Strain LLF1b" /LENGTH=92 /DNA_ID=CAMNT_0026920759 /DNA_START=395 /DNA_END=673 /DNA_ORIENTATION=+
MSLFSRWFNRAELKDVVTLHTSAGCQTCARSGQCPYHSGDAMPSAPAIENIPILQQVFGEEIPALRSETNLKKVPVKLHKPCLKPSCAYCKS